MRRLQMKCYDLLSQKQIPFVATAIAPANPVAFNPMGTDSLRVAYNAEQAEAVEQLGGVWVDLATPANGAVDANGQMGIAASASPDGVHFSETQDQTVNKPLLKAAVKRALGLL